MDASYADIVSNLEEAQKKLRVKMVELEARDQAIQQAIDGISGVETKEIHSNKPASLSVSNERLQKVLKYVQKHPNSRQSDITKNVKLNSGSVSVALRKLKEEGIIVKTGRDNGANVWTLAQIQKMEKVA